MSAPTMGPDDEDDLGTGWRPPWGPDRDLQVMILVIVIVAVCCSCLPVFR